MKPKIGIIIQARIRSTRLPAKVMLDLAGRPLIYRIVERLKRCKLVDEIIVAVPEKEESNIIKDAISELNVSVFEGSEDDVFDRYTRCAIAHNLDYVVRFPADNPMPGWDVIDELISWHLENNPNGFSSNLSSVFSNGMVDGIGGEMISGSILVKENSKKLSAEKREHPHLNFYNYALKKSTNEQVQVGSPPVSDWYKRPNYLFDINSLEEYLFVSPIFSFLKILKHRSADKSYIAGAKSAPAI